MILELKNKIGSGAFGEVFRDGGKAYKLFVSAKHPKRASNSAEFGHGDDDRRRNIFRSECNAYDRALEDAFLRDHVPNFYGVCRICDVRNHTGESIADQYMRDLCYAMDFIDGGRPTNFNKLDPAHIQKAKNAFLKAGIDYRDASVFFPSDEQKFRIIDFAVREFPPN